MDLNQSKLTQEVKILHLQFFQRDASQDFIERYQRFHKDLPEMTQATGGELRTVSVIIERRLDALGIEPWLRGGPTRHLLSRKLLLIAYLAECDAAHLESGRVVKGRWRSLLQLCGRAVWGSGQLFKGRLQKALYGLL